MAAAPERTDPAATEATETVAVKGNVFTLEVAATPQAREKGPMFRTELAFDGGMLFVFPDDRMRLFWMCNTRIPLDILFLDKDGRITAMHTMYPEEPRGEVESEEAYHQRLPLYSSRAPARYAIEFKAGTLGLLALSVGDTIPLDVERLRKHLRPNGD